MAPDYLICRECETPCYVFEWDDGRMTDVKCGGCGNDDPDKFKSVGD